MINAKLFSQMSEYLVRTRSYGCSLTNSVVFWVCSVPLFIYKCCIYIKLARCRCWFRYRIAGKRLGRLWEVCFSRGGWWENLLWSRRWRSSLAGSLGTRSQIYIFVIVLGLVATTRVYEFLVPALSCPDIYFIQSLSLLPFVVLASIGITWSS